MKITIIGSGHVGLVTGACFAEKGHHVLCVDNDSDKIKGLLTGTMPFYEPGMEEMVNRNAGEGRLAWRLRWWGWWLARRPGSPFELLAEFRHPVVRAELRRTRARRLRVTAVCVGLPLLLFLLVFAARRFGVFY